MGITYGDHLIDSGYYDIMHEQEREIEAMAHGDALPEQSTIREERARWNLDRALLLRWQTAETAPKDGTHILVCEGPYTETWGFAQRPPVVVHYWSNPGEEGFYPSHGLVEGSYNDRPMAFTHWSPLGHEPR